MSDHSDLVSWAAGLTLMAVTGIAAFTVHQLYRMYKAGVSGDPERVNAEIRYWLTGVEG